MKNLPLLLLLSALLIPSASFGGINDLLVEYKSDLLIRLYTAYHHQYSHEIIKAYNANKDITPNSEAYRQLSIIHNQAKAHPYIPHWPAIDSLLSNDTTYSLPDSVAASPMSNSKELNQFVLDRIKRVYKKTEVVRSAPVDSSNITVAFPSYTKPYSVSLYNKYNLKPADTVFVDIGRGTHVSAVIDSLYTVTNHQSWPFALCRILNSDTANYKPQRRELFLATTQNNATITPITESLDFKGKDSALDSLYTVIDSVFITTLQDQIDFVQYIPLTKPIRDSLISMNINSISRNYTIDRYTVSNTKLYRIMTVYKYQNKPIMAIQSECILSGTQFSLQSHTSDLNVSPSREAEFYGMRQATDMYSYYIFDVNRDGFPEWAYSFSAWESGGYTVFNFKALNSTPSSFTLYHDGI